MSNALLAIFAFVDLGSRGHETQFAWPAHGEVVLGKTCSFAEVRIPTFVSSHVQDAVAGIFDNVAVVTEAKRKFAAGWHSGGEYHVQRVIPAGGTFLRAHAFVLKEGKRMAVLIFDRIRHQRARELEDEVANAGPFGAQAYGCGSLERDVGKNGCLNRIVNSTKRDGRSREIGRCVGSPNIEENAIAVFSQLVEQERFNAFRVEQEIERTNGSAAE